MGTTESFKLEPLLSVQIQDDDYTALLTVLATDAATPFISNDVADYLRRHSVVFGFHVRKLDEVIHTLKAGPSGTTFTVAKGKKMSPGKDGNEQYRFRTALLAGAQTESKTDYRERGLINNVRAGQVIATIEKEVIGKPGMTVTGLKIDPPPVARVTVYAAGINVERYAEENRFTYVAMVAGHARKLIDEIQVTKDFMIDGDIDYKNGNINFVGNVGISGDVKSGFSVIAAGNISIGGNVEPGAKVTAGKSITVRGTVRCGMESGLFEAKDDISARSVISSKIQAGKNVFIKEYFGDSEVYCEGVFASAFGTIVGSTIEAIGGIRVNNIGKEESLSKNAVYSGKSVISEERLKKITEELKSCHNEMALLAKKVAIERDNDSPENEQDPSKADRMKQIGLARTKHAKQIQERIEAIEKEKLILQQRFAVNPEAKMEVKGKLFPTALLCNGTNELKVNDTPHHKVTLTYLAESKPAG